MQSLGSLLILERVSPFITILNFPDKLVLRVRADGAYRYAQWSRNGQIILGNVGSLPQTFVHFGDIYVIQDTTMIDLGIYNVQLMGSGLQPSNVISFVVVDQGKPKTTI